MIDSLVHIAVLLLCTDIFSTVERELRDYALNTN